MSIGNLKDQGNKGNNFPYQLSAVRLAGKDQLLNLTEVNFQETTAANLTAIINTYFNTNKNKFLVSKAIVINPSTSKWEAFLTVATL